MTEFTVVVPTNRPDRLVAFLDSFKGQFQECNLVIVEDAKVKSKIIKEALKSCPCEQAVHLDRNEAFDLFPYTPIGSDMIRSAGFLYAEKNLYSDAIVTLDDDVRASHCNLMEEYSEAFKKGARLSPYFSVSALTDSEYELRGYPIKDRGLKPVGLQYGGWSGVLDYDAITQLQIQNNPEYGTELFTSISIPVPKHTPVTGCIMNAAWKIENNVLMWQLPLLEGRYNRFGDIWSGLFAKKSLDLLGEVVLINGLAQVTHQKASDPYSNLIKESVGYEINEGVWDAIKDVEWTQTPAKYYADCTAEVYRKVTDAFIQYISKKDPAYGAFFEEARECWIKGITDASEF